MVTYLKKASLAEKRSNVYGFLSMIYASELTRDFLDGILEKDFAAILRELGVVFDDFFETMDREQLLEELTCEYTRLYIGTGPKHIPPYESVHIDSRNVRGEKTSGLMWGESTVAVQNEYRQHGYQPLPFFKDIPDHLGVELGLMRLLTAEEKEAWERRDKAIALERLESQRKFLDEHLVHWVPTFCDQAAEFAQFKFYQSLAELTKEYVLLEHSQMDELIDQAKKC